MSKKHEQHGGTSDHDEALADMYHRLEREMLDSFDEELEMELDDQRFHDEVGSPEDAAKARAKRRQYFKELLRLQGELVKLQDWVAHTGYRMIILFEGRDAAAKVVLSNALHSGLIPGLFVP